MRTLMTLVTEGVDVNSEVFGRGCEPLSVMTEAKKPTGKMVAYKIVRFDGPKNVSDKIIDRTVIHAATTAERDQKIKAWMEKIGLDPEDEDDQTYIDIALE